MAKHDTDMTDHPAKRKGLREKDKGEQLVVNSMQTSVRDRSGAI